MKSRAIVSVLIMIVAGIAGLYLGAALNDNGFGCPILCSMIAGIGCIIYAIDNPKQ